MEPPPAAEPDAPARIVGRRRAEGPGAAFARVQRLAAPLLAGRLGPRGVHRFRTYEEYEAWKTRQRQHPARPATSTSSDSAAS